MEEKVPYIVHEGSVARLERIIKRLTLALIIAILLIFVSNAVWLYYWNQFDYLGETKTVTVDSTSGIANYIGNNGDILNGSDSGSDQETD